MQQKPLDQGRLQSLFLVLINPRIVSINRAAENLDAHASRFGKPSELDGPPRICAIIAVRLQRTAWHVRPARAHHHVPRARRGVGEVASRKAAERAQRAAKRRVRWSAPRAVKCARCEVLPNNASRHKHVARWTRHDKRVAFTRKMLGNSCSRNVLAAAGARRGGVPAGFCVVFAQARGGDQAAVTACDWRALALSRVVVLR